MLSAWERRVVNAKNRKRARRKDRRKSEGKKRAKISLTTIKLGRLMTHTHTYTSEAGVELNIVSMHYGIYH